MRDAQVDQRGLLGDRQFMVVDSDGVFYTQRNNPSMALVEVARDESGVLHLQAPGMPPLLVTMRAEGRHVPVRIWDHGSYAVDQGDEAALWFSEFLRTDCRLVATGNAFRRLRATSSNLQISLGFSDHYPIVVATRESLDYLNRHAQHPIQLNRFRANIVLSGCEPFEENTWGELQIGDVRLAMIEECGRCSVTGIEQETGKLSKEPLRSLATIQVRAQPKVVFGIHMAPITTGKISLNSGVGIIRTVRPKTTIGPSRGDAPLP